MKLSGSSSYRIFILVLLVFTSFQNDVKAQITAGDIMFVGYNADGNDGFALAVLNAIPAVTTIYITDNGWNGTALAATEGILTWTVTTTIPAGVVVVFNNVATAPIVSSGTVTGTGNFNLAAGGESIYVYEGTPTVPTNFITSFSSNGYGAGNTLAGTGLTAGTNATSLTGNDDVCVYVPTSPCATTIGPCSALLANPTNWSCEDGGGDQSNDGGIDFPSSVPLAPTVSVLPIELISFNANRDEANQVELEWKTSSELNNDFFEIERRTDKEDWEVVAKVTGAGNSVQLKSYSIKDMDVPSSLIYYRLSQTDFDGRKVNFRIESIQAIRGDEQFVVYPNPIEDVFYVRSFRIKEADVKLIDHIGKDVTNLIQSSAVDSNTMKVEVGDLKPAVYFLQVNDQRKQIVIL